MLATCSGSRLVLSLLVLNFLSVAAMTPCANDYLMELRKNASMMVSTCLGIPIEPGSINMSMFANQGLFMDKCQVSFANISSCLSQLENYSFPDMSNMSCVKEMSTAEMKNESVVTQEIKMYAMQAWQNVTMNGKGILSMICLNVNGSFCLPEFLSLSLAANVTEPGMDRQTAIMAIPTLCSSPCFNALLQAFESLVKFFPPPGPAPANPMMMKQGFEYVCTIKDSSGKYCFANSYATMTSSAYVCSECGSLVMRGDDIACPLRGG
ncbi:hypothetical protein GUITHDRAFT_145874 [Guillardia theta CCMP2712]|uniref:Uncharacterized protein n=1 Tax=Guillardia theta (strain CCMP2712) TaxID=905079 RepID=L1IJB0_GUITC|nr:hypothetical protein GUITHDRAFT_145874 [Guillardia theta CCMP2712]EKX36306.1 hypothetical protein GUITHDRAFT_145874 [Guillardia theta CCMP2712]|eukprot:XP_005823286.1 hypothetical protein GUITHDRAFT_145874 [Guillardia theta CCMP2712]